MRNLNMLINGYRVSKTSIELLGPSSKKPANILQPVEPTTREQPMEVPKKKIKNKRLNGHKCSCTPQQGILDVAQTSRARGVREIHDYN